MIRRLSHAFLLLYACCNSLVAGAQTGQTDSITGTWKGTSLCQVKDSPCHDEKVVYHISKTDKPLDYNLQMNKIVNGEEEVMGSILFTFDPVKHELVATPKPYILWRFKLIGGRIDGTLIYHDQLYRVVAVEKQL